MKLGNQTPQIHQGAGALPCLPSHLLRSQFAPPNLLCRQGFGRYAPRYAPLTAQVGEALGRYEDGSGGQAKRGKRGRKQGIP